VSPATATSRPSGASVRNFGHGFVTAQSDAARFLVSTPEERVRGVAVTSGIGMTTALGLAEHVLEDLFDDAPTTV